MLKSVANHSGVYLIQNQKMPVNFLVPAFCNKFPQDRWFEPQFMFKRHVCLGKKDADVQYISQIRSFSCS